jgi:hypothetical protein
MRDYENGSIHSKAHISNPARGNNADCVKVRTAPELEPWPGAAMEYTLLKERSEELKQFVSLTSATSSCSAKVMSTHYWEILLVFVHVMSDSLKT